MHKCLLALAVLIVFFGCVDSGKEVEKTAGALVLNNAYVDSSGRLLLDVNYSPVYLVTNPSIKFGPGVSKFDINGMECQVQIKTGSISDGTTANLFESTSEDGKAYSVFSVSPSDTKKRPIRIYFLGKIEQPCLGSALKSGVLAVSVSVVERGNNIDDVFNPPKTNASNKVTVLDAQQFNKQCNDYELMCTAATVTSGCQETSCNNGVCIQMDVECATNKYAIDIQKRTTIGDLTFSVMNIIEKPENEKGFKSFTVDLRISNNGTKETEICHGIYIKDIEGRYFETNYTFMAYPGGTFNTCTFPEIPGPSKLDSIVYRDLNGSEYTPIFKNEQN
mgnify:CR=1 FL=1